MVPGMISLNRLFLLVVALFFGLASAAAGEGATTTPTDLDSDHEESLIAGNTGGIWNGLKTSLKFLTKLSAATTNPYVHHPKLHGRTPKHSLSVFVAGRGRSGTASLAEAFKLLGYSPVHGPDVLAMAATVREMHMPSPDSSFHERATAFLNRTAPQEFGFDASGFDSFGYLWREAAALDHVKIILNIRGSPEQTLREQALQWADSWASTVGTHFTPLSQRPFTWVPELRNLQEYLSAIVESVTNGNCANHPNNRTALVDGYENLISNVRALNLPPSRYLEFYTTDKSKSDEQKWRALCVFLELDPCAPLATGMVTPFPNVNDRSAMVVLGYVFVAVTWVWPILPLLPVVLVYACVRFVGCVVRHLRANKGEKKD